ncbi:MAG: 4-hydroxy-tetrahydrodipicolinate reductase [Deltaproteobacteria bacterium]|nr:4-hydroxy-tetrahydrodipicolinate reductase [Deltaproteobacteria bacterium]
MSSNNLTSNSKGVLVVGALGKMGVCVREALTQEPRLHLSVGLERPGYEEEAEVPSFTLTSDAEQALESADVVIDFSVPDASLALVRLCAARGIPSVIGTTGFSEAQRAEISSAAQSIPIVLAPNFSVAVNVLGHLTERASELMGDDYDAEIMEIHHGAKRDAPSGTALWLGERVAAGRAQELAKQACYTRHGEIGARPEGEIGLQTLRGGDVAGEHTIYFFGDGERLELTHRASTRNHFARGAVRAATWVVDQANGLYGMDRVLGLD